MTNIPPVGEDDLQAWVDGRLSPGRAEVVDTFLQANPEERARLTRYADQKRALREALVGEDGPIPARLQLARLTASARQRARLLFFQIAAAVILLILGGTVGWTARELAGALGWGTTTAAYSIIQDAIAAYRTFSVEVLHPVEVPASQQDHLRNWLSNRLGRRLIIPDLDSFDLRLIGGRLLPSENGPAAQLMYADANGNRFTVYIQVVPYREMRTYRSDKSIGALLWIDESFGCVMVGHADRDFLSRIGESVYKQMLPEAPVDEKSRQRNES